MVQQDAADLAQEVLNLRNELSAALTALEWGICGVGVLPHDRRMKDVMDAQDCLYTLVLKHPDGTLEPRRQGVGFLGLGIDEDTALVVRGHLAEVVGQGSVTFVDGRGVRFDTANEAQRPGVGLGAIVVAASLLRIPHGEDSIYQKCSRLWAGTLNRIAGVTIVVHDEERIVHGKPRVYISNHVSWFDVFVLGEILPNYTFIAKRELSRIPIFGWAAKGWGVIWIDRGNRHEPLTDRSSRPLTGRATSSSQRERIVLRRRERNTMRQIAQAVGASTSTVAVRLPSTTHRSVPCALPSLQRASSESPAGASAETELERAGLRIVARNWRCVPARPHPGVTRWTSCGSRR